MVIVMVLNLTNKDSGQEIRLWVARQGEREERENSWEQAASYKPATLGSGCEVRQPCCLFSPIGPVILLTSVLVFLLLTRCTSPIMALDLTIFMCPGQTRLQHWLG